MMLKRYVKIKDLFTFIKQADVHDLLLSEEDDSAVHHLCIHLHDLDSVMKALQEESVNLAEARGLSDAGDDTVSPDRVTDLF